MATFETSTRRPEIDNKQTLETAPVQAYAKLESEDFCYYIRTLQVTLGRKVNKPDNVDIPLGNIKSVSRQHARLFYNFATQRFELMVFGKNGAFVNEQFVEKGVTVPLENKTKIQIGELSFVFLLPRMDAEEAAPVHHDSSGYISAPQQLEKKRTLHQDKRKRPSIQLSPAKEDAWVDMASPDDITLHASPDIKPPFSYASLIAQAINSTANKRMTLNGIYTFITTRYPYYQMASNGWQNSIRHNLSLNKAFVKVPRNDTEPGKGAFWTIDSTAENQFSKGMYKKLKISNSISKEPLSSSSSSVSRRQSEHDGHGVEQEEDFVADQDEDEEAGGSDNDLTQVKNEQLDVPGTTTTTLKLNPEQTDVKRELSSPTLDNKTLLSAAVGQSQLQATIQHHLLDPVKYPLPPSIAQLLPQAIAQLPPQLAIQISNTLKAAGKSSRHK
ncbi:hypothetical protein [Parasitella parasitica]|uniref:FHA domain-containing protein n=1 Tax=Parasitella parasitica TaxID=35722 RepID=A0A0B7NIE8_9FUNG|nr:hypothetical protein [Parasitella parasitica]